MATIGELAVNVVARTRGLTAGLKQAKGQLSAFSRFGSVAMRGVAAGAGLAAAGFMSLVRTNEQLNKAMNRSLAIMGDVSDKMRGAMTKAAIDVAKTTNFSARQAADSYFFLASAGMDAAQSLQAMPTVAVFAQSGMFDLATATDLLTDSQSALGLSSKDATENLTNMKRVGDVLVKANTIANASVEQFAQSLTNKAAAAARLVGHDVEQATAVLAAFADQGIKGAEAGTAYAIVMRDLQTKAIGNTQAFEAAKVAVFDQSGEMRNMSAIVSDLETRLDGLSDKTKKSVLLDMGFSDKSVAFLATLIGTSEKMAEFEKGLRAAGGTMENVAGKQLTPMEIALNKLKGTWTEVSTQTGEFTTLAVTGIGALEGLAVAAAKLAGVYGDLGRSLGNWMQQLADSSAGGRQIAALLGTDFGIGSGQRDAFANYSAISDKERSKFVDAPEGGMPTMSEGQVAKNQARAKKNARMENNRKIWNAALDRKKEDRERKRIEAKAPARKTADLVIRQGEQLAGAIPKLFTGAFGAVQGIERKATAGRVKSGISPLGQESLLPDWLKKKDEFKKTGQIKPTKKTARIDTTLAGTQMGSAAAFTALRRNLKDPMQKKLLKENQKQSLSLKTIAANTANLGSRHTESAPGLGTR